MEKKPSCSSINVAALLHNTAQTGKMQISAKVMFVEYMHGNFCVCESFHALKFYIYIVFSDWLALVSSVDPDQMKRECMDCLNLQIEVQ